MERSADWMIQAEGDLLHARNDVAGRYYEWACFSAQQAAEKAVKAVFQRMGAEAWGAPRTRYTHGEAMRLIGDAEEIYRFCSDLLSTI